MNNIIVTGSDSRFGKILKKFNDDRFIFRNKKQLNILSNKSIISNFKKFKPNIVLHLAGLSRPMKAHEINIIKSINLNIIGTCNLVKAASKFRIKVIYLSTSYVYPGIRGNYKEEDQKPNSYLEWLFF